MAKRHSTKRALAMSMLSLLLCVTMLVGTTYAWFTDSVSSVNNKIVSGSLDIELEYYDTAANSWKNIADSTNLFSDGLWEPGYTEVVYLRVSNKGNLALRYQLGVNVASEKPGINKAGEIFRLSDYIEFGVVETATETFYGERADARENVENPVVISKGYSKSSKLYPAGNPAGLSEEYVALVVYMPETVGNEANYKVGTSAPEIDLGINVIATQLVYENDTFGPDYDKNAPWTGEVGTVPAADAEGVITIMTAEELAGFAASVNGGNNYSDVTVKLGADIDLNNVAWTPIGTNNGWATKFDGKFYGNGYTVSNLYVTGTTGLGLFGYVGDSAHLEGVKIDGAYVSGSDYVGAVMGSGYLAKDCIKDCYVKNATVIATPVLKSEGLYDGGAKAGVIAGYAINGSLVGNTAEDSSVYAYRDLGGVAGMLSGEGRAVAASGNTVKNVTLGYVGVAGSYVDGKANENMGEIIGRLKNATVDDTNAFENVTMDTTGAFVITTLEQFVEFGKTVNAGNTYNGKTVLLGADIDLSGMEWTPIGTSANSFHGTFDGQGHTVKNLVVTGNNNYAGLFGFTKTGAVKNLTIENAKVSGRVGVGALAGSPYTTEYSNITLKGHVEINGLAYVGGLGGRNAYADWTNITIDTDATSYVKAVSIENGTTYRTYVGGVIGFVGEGDHVFKNITSNIDVIGSTQDAGGIVGIAHYGTSYINCVCTGDVMITNAAQADEAEEIGGIAGVWHNQTDYTVTFEDCAFEGTLNVNYTDGVDLTNNTITGKAYNNTGKGELVIINWTEENGIKFYTDGVTGDFVLYHVTGDYTDDELVIPEGVTYLGNGSIGSAASKTVKKVVLPSTLNGMGTAFQKNTVIEEVVLNEGLTVIPDKAFNQATALKSINIPSTVETIGFNAFRMVAIEELVIPATVKELAEGVFRDSPVLKKVTFEGDTKIGSFAFRGCPALETVILEGYGVTFAGTSMAFSNNTAGNSNLITIYVKTATVEKRVKAANGSCTGYTVVVDSAYEEVAGAEGILTDAAGNYYVSGAEGFSWIEAQSDTAFAGKTISLLCDIDMTDVDYKPIRFFDPENPTTFDGQGYTISNLTIDNSSAANQALFNGVVNVKNLNVDNAFVSGNGYAAVIGGSVYGNIENCHVTNSTVVGGYWQVGGIVAQHDSGNILNCSIVDSTITGPSAVGAIVGITNESAGVRRIENCKVEGCDITANYGFGGDYDNFYGAIVGLINIENSTVYMTGCTVSDTTVKGVETNAFYGVVESGTQVIVD